MLYVLNWAKRQGWCLNHTTVHLRDQCKSLSSAHTHAPKTLPGIPSPALPKLQLLSPLHPMLSCEGHSLPGGDPHHRHGQMPSVTSIPWGTANLSAPVTALRCGGSRSQQLSQHPEHSQRCWTRTELCACLYTSKGTVVTLLWVNSFHFTFWVCVFPFPMLGSFSSEKPTHPYY